MSRIRLAGKILRPVSPISILDVGCRDGSLAAELPDADYSGADLFPGPAVKYVGDITQLKIDRSFDTVVAMDILEHLPTPSETFDKLFALAERHFLISLPNTYHLKLRYNFARKGMLNGKYLFTEAPQLDRHHWLISREEARQFANVKAEKHGAKLKLLDMSYGAEGNRIGKVLTATLPPSLTTETVFALFTRN